MYAASLKIAEIVVWCMQYAHDSCQLAMNDRWIRVIFKPADNFQPTCRLRVVGKRNVNDKAMREVEQKFSFLI